MRNANHKRVFLLVVASPFSLIICWFNYFLNYGPLQQLNEMNSLALSSGHNTETLLTDDDKASEATYGENFSSEEYDNKSSLEDNISTFADTREIEQLNSDSVSNQLMKGDDYDQLDAANNVPNLLIVGAQKAGTTAVQSWIDLHSNVCRAASVPDGKPVKEVQFFNNDSLFSKGPDFYRLHFRFCTKQMSILMDSTPDYLPHAARVRETYDQFGGSHANDLKILMILREPVAREYSWFNHMVLNSKKANPPRYTQRVLDDRRRGGIRPFVDYLHRSVFPKIDSSYGQYAKWLRLWMDHFDRKQILVLSYEELMNDPASVIWRLRNFLGLREERVRNDIAVRNKKSGIAESPPLYCNVQGRLNEEFRYANEELYDLLDEHLGPEMEQKPFPKFKVSPCIPDRTNGQEQ